MQCDTHAKAVKREEGDISGGATTRAVERETGRKIGHGHGTWSMEHGGENVGAPEQMRRERGPRMEISLRSASNTSCTLHVPPVAAAAALWHGGY